MRSFGSLGVFCLVALSASAADAATIAGTVTGPDGAPFRGAFVQARNATTKITVSVLSDTAGHYQVPDLTAGDYRLSIRAPGYKSDPKSGITLTADQNAAADFGLQKGLVRWSDISLYQGFKLLPEGHGKELFFTHCVACHGFRDPHGGGQAGRRRLARPRRLYARSHGLLHQPAAAAIQRPEGGRDRLLSQRRVRRGFDAAELAGRRCRTTRRRCTSSATRRSRSSTSNMKHPGPSRMPWSAYPDKDGNFWIPYYGRANKIGELNPVSGVIKEFPVPETGTAAIHSAVPAPDGSVWLTEQGTNKLGRWDPKTQKITEFQDDWGKHTARVDANGQVWSTGGLTRYDPKYGTFTHIADVPNAYGIALDKDGNAWFAELRKDGRIGKVDAKTLQVTKYQPPTATGFPRRIQVDSDGVVWFAEFQGGKIGQFDPKSERFKEFQLPGEKPTPYALGIDADHKVWYSSEWMDVIGRLDPATGNVVEFPFPHAENTMREFTTDAKGRFWYASPANDRVGYFYLAK